MNRLFGILVLCLASTAPALAQTTPQFEVFGGGTWLRADISPNLAPLGVAQLNALGWNMSATENMNRWFGGTVDFSGAYSRPKITDTLTGATFSNQVNTSVYTFTFGPSFAYRKGGRIVLFGRALFGAANARASTTSKGTLAAGTPAKFSDTTFAIVSGGGADFSVSRVIALRGTADWVRSTFQDFGNDRQNSVRVSAGIVFRFGTVER
jgi:hypothetical protein